MSQAFSPGRIAPPGGSEPCPSAVMLANTHSCGPGSRVPQGGVAPPIHSASCQRQGQTWGEIKVGREKVISWDLQVVDRLPPARPLLGMVPTTQACALGWNRTRALHKIPGRRTFISRGGPS
uniref:Uncharacterized protein n=1 Tax=Pipistrellus kuhlii TaxID=59472 RepID=A0A7J7QUM9_PIPKU|nr:hypothetical protein mPipKuh1_008453 [Pipistrellus kuhlii]